MPNKYLYFVTLTIVSLLVKGTFCFFVKQTHKWKCIRDTGKIQSSGSWGNLSFLEFSDNSCLDPSAQFRFRDNGAMLSLKRQGSVAAFNRNGSGYNLDMFYLFVDSVSLDTNACAQKPNESIYRAITQTPDGGLSVYYKGKHSGSFEMWFARDTYSYTLDRIYGISLYIGLWQTGWKRLFRFGSVTCHGEMVANANCPKDQYMVVKFASYRGLPVTKKCGSSDDYICEVDVTCVVKRKCDGEHECSVTVDEKLIPGDPCPGLSNYLHFEYQCVDAKKSYIEYCVEDVFLSYSSVPYKGVLQITVDKQTKNVCFAYVNKVNVISICRQLGYQKVYSVVGVPLPIEATGLALSYYLYCNGYEEYVSQCPVSIANSKSCPKLSYIECISSELLLHNKHKFPDSLFSASASSKSHSASDARISSGSSWCAPVGKHFLQVDLGRRYRLDYLVTYGDSKSKKWVATYKLNYTIDLKNWKTLPKIFQGNKNAFNRAAEQFIDVTTRALRLIPLTHVGESCMRVDFRGKTVFPDKPKNLSVSNITSRSVRISWIDPQNKGIFNISKFWIKLKKNNSRFRDITTKKGNEFQINNLTPFTAYEVSVTAGNSRGFSEESAITSFSTHEEAPSGTPLSIKTIARSATSLFITWQPPEKTMRNGVIASYTACISHLENAHCLQTFSTMKTDWLVRNLNASTKYYVRVLASTTVGVGNYSESRGFFTNGSPPQHLDQTSKSLTFSLEIPTKPFLYFYVVALKLTEDQETVSSDNYDEIDLLNFSRMQNKTKPKPYIAAVFTSSGVGESTFILGDGRITDYPTSRTTSYYYNGPLEPGTSYKIFQRIVINEEHEYYSTDWSSTAKTSEETGTDENDVSGKYFAGIVATSAILLVLLLVFIPYLVHRICFKSQNTKRGQETTDTGNNLENADNPERFDASIYEEVSDEQFYSSLNRSGEEIYDDRCYAHLNQVIDTCVRQEETGL